MHNSNRISKREAKLLSENEVVERLLDGAKERLYKRFCLQKDEEGALSVYRSFCGLVAVEQELKATINEGLYSGE
jgi:hypothetical protein